MPAHALGPLQVSDNGVTAINLVLTQISDALDINFEEHDPLVAPPEVETSSAIGTVPGRYAASDHTHSGMNLTDAQTAAGAKTFSAKVTCGGEVEIDGALNHDGTTVGFYGTAPATQAAAIATLTDSTGATANNVVEDVPAATGDAGGAATVSAANAVATVASVNTALTAIENDIADLTAKVNAITAALRTIGIIAT